MGRVVRQHFHVGIMKGKAAGRHQIADAQAGRNAPGAAGIEQQITAETVNDQLGAGGGRHGPHAENGGDGFMSGYRQPAQAHAAALFIREGGKALKKGGGLDLHGKQKSYFHGTHTLKRNSVTSPSCMT